jgi:hypothetical protein
MQNENKSGVLLIYINLHFEDDMQAFCVCLVGCKTLGSHNVFNSMVETFCNLRSSHHVPVSGGNQIESTETGQ